MAVRLCTPRSFCDGDMEPPHALHIQNSLAVYESYRISINFDAYCSFIRSFFLLKFLLRFAATLVRSLWNYARVPYWRQSNAIFTFVVQFIFRFIIFRFLHHGIFILWQSTRECILTITKYIDIGIISSMQFSYQMHFMFAPYFNALQTICHHHIYM